MAFNATQFRQTMTGHGARANLFEVEVTFPDDDGGAGNKFTFTCRSAQLPASTIGVAEAYYFGRRVSFAGDRTFQDFQVQVIVDEDHLVRKAFEKWQNRLGIIDHNTNRVERKDGKAVYSNMTVKHYAKEGGQAIKTYTLYNAFPVDIGAVELDWQENDTIMMFPIVLRYDFFDIDGVRGDLVR